MTEPAVCAVVLAAGAGTRLRPLTATMPKALCPVGNVALLDRALTRFARLGLAGAAQVAVNACHHAEQIVAHVEGRARTSVEPGTLLGTAGAVVRLRDWIAGRGVLVANADGYLWPRRTTADDPDDAAHAADPDDADLAPLLAGWDGQTVRMLGVPAAPGYPYPFGRFQFAGVSLLPWWAVAALPTGVSELVGTVWRPAERAGRLEVIEYRGGYLDTGTPADYLAANLHAASVEGLDGSLIAPDAQVTGSVAHSVVGAGARVRGQVSRSVVWPDGEVGRDERLADTIRAGSHTITV